MVVSSLLLAMLPYYYASIYILGHDDGHPPPSSSSQSSGSSPSPIPRPKATIAYAISLTSCGNGSGGGQSSDDSLMEGAAVLRHSIHLSSIRNWEYSRSVFDYVVRDACIVYYIFVEDAFPILRCRFISPLFLSSRGGTNAPPLHRSSFPSLLPPAQI